MQICIANLTNQWKSLIAAKMEMIPHWLPICIHDQKHQGQDSQHFIDVVCSAALL